jgi:hypothetical protein
MGASDYMVVPPPQGPHTPLPWLAFSSAKRWRTCLISS